MKAVIPVAGLGTRLLPASKAIPKEMLPVGDKPVIQWIIEEAASAGITQIILVTRYGKEAIENHFDSHYEVEHELGLKGKTDLLNKVRSTVPKNIDLISVRQNKALGLGHAILCARHVLGNEAFAVLLPDVLMLQKPEQVRSDLAEMVKYWQTSGNAQILVAPVPDDQVDQYGIVDCGGATLDQGQSTPITNMIEKPSVQRSPSNLSVVGRYILPAEILKVLESTPSGAGGEIQLTDAMVQLLQRHPINAYQMAGDTYDCGNKMGYAQAQVIAAMQNQEMKTDFLAFLKQVVSDS